MLTLINHKLQMLYVISTCTMHVATVLLVISEIFVSHIDLTLHFRAGTQWKLSDRLMCAVSDCCSRLYEGIWSWKCKCSSAVQKWNVYDCVNNDLWSCAQGFKTACALFVSADGEWKTITGICRKYKCSTHFNLCCYHVCFLDFD